MERNREFFTYLGSGKNFSEVFSTSVLYLYVKEYSLPDVMKNNNAA